MGKLINKKTVGTGALIAAATVGAGYHETLQEIAGVVPYVAVMAYRSEVQTTLMANSTEVHEAMLDMTEEMLDNGWFGNAAEALEEIGELEKARELWLQIARKAEKGGDRVQAYSYYEKLGDEEGMDRCRPAILAEQQLLAIAEFNRCLESSTLASARAALKEVTDPSEDLIERLEEAEGEEKRWKEAEAKKRRAAMEDSKPDVQAAISAEESADAMMRNDPGPGPDRCKNVMELYAKAARIFNECGKRNEAKRCRQKAVKASETWTNVFWQADALRLNGQNGKAKRILLQAAKQALQGEKYDYASRLFDNVNDRNEPSNSQYKRIAKTAFSNGDFEVAARYYDKADDKKNAENSYVKAAQEAEREGDHRSAAYLYVDAGRHVEAAIAWRKYAEQRLNEGEYIDAEGGFKAAGLSDEEAADIISRQAEADENFYDAKQYAKKAGDAESVQRITLKKQKESLEIAKKLVVRIENNDVSDLISSWSEAGSLFAEAGDVANARNAYAKAAELAEQSSRDIYPHFIAGCYEKSGNPDTARKYWLIAGEKILLDFLNHKPFYKDEGDEYFAKAGLTQQQIFIVKGDACMKHSRYTDAMEYYEKGGDFDKAVLAAKVQHKGVLRGCVESALRWGHTSVRHFARMKALRALKGVMTRKEVAGAI